MEHVYFIRSADWLKVGYSASVYNRWLQHRSRETSKYGELTFLGCFEGSMVDEKSIHRVLSYRFPRDRREWFNVPEQFSIRELIGDKVLLGLQEMDGYRRGPASAEFGKLKDLPRSSAARFEAVRSYKAHTRSKSTRTSRGVRYPA